MLKVPFDALTAGMQTGDLILFNGQYTGSRLIELMQNSEWSHVGMVVRLPQFDQPLLWEATSLTNLPDVLIKDRTKGPKLVILRDRLSHYGDELERYKKANFAYRQLNVNRSPEMLQKLEQYISDHHGMPEPGFWEMIWDVFKGRILHMDTKPEKYFCSALIAETCQAMALLDDSKPINAYMPVDFSDQGKLKLLLNAYYESEVLIDIQHL